MSLVEGASYEFNAEDPCHDCNVLFGQNHHSHCDVEECPNCGGQVLSCECDKGEG